MPRINGLDEFIDHYLTEGKPVTDLNQVKTVDDHIPYQGVKYDRSDVRFAHVPLMSYLKDRELKLPEQMEALIENMPAGTFIAGGSVATLMNDQSAEGTYAKMYPSDIDLFFANQEAADAAIKLLEFAGKEVQGPEGVRMFAPRADGGGLPVQAITIEWFPNGIEEVLDSFDFTVTHFGIDTAAKELVFNPVAPLDFTARRLLNHRVEGDEWAKKRLAKYIGKGLHPVGETAVRAKAWGLPFVGMFK